MYSGGDMAENTWVDGSYVDASGAWVPDAEPAQWRSYAGRWWYTFPDGSYPENEWAAINGAWYYFGEDGWMLDKGWHWIRRKMLLYVLRRSYGREHMDRREIM